MAIRYVGYVNILNLQTFCKLFVLFFEANAYKSITSSIFHFVIFPCFLSLLVAKLTNWTLITLVVENCDGYFTTIIARLINKCLN